MPLPTTILDQLDTFGPQRCRQLTYPQADAYTRKLARSHYENFTVASWLLPRRLRAGFRHVYCFCRWADDLADEAGDPARALELLDWWRDELDRCYAGRPRHPVFVALSPTIERSELERRPFDDVLDAFVQDQRVTRYETFAQVLDYCTRSANPVGRLVLQLCGYRDDQRRQLSDATCTALQLTNFWQDVRRDIVERDRVYLPRDVAEAHGLDIDLMVEAVRTSAAGAAAAAGMSAIATPCRAALRDLVGRTASLFAQGRALWPLLSPDVRPDVKLFTRGGESVLRLIRGQGYDTLERRPRLGVSTKAGLILRAAWGRMLPGKGAR